MTVVVSDSSPIRALAHLGLLPLLSELCGEVFIPSAVLQEVTRRGRILRFLHCTGIETKRTFRPRRMAARDLNSSSAEGWASTDQNHRLVTPPRRRLPTSGF